MSVFKNKLFFFVTISLSLGILLFVIAAIVFNPVGCDSSYYLSCSELIKEGLIPYSDFPLGYTPLFIYIMAGIKSVFNVEVNYSFDLFVWSLFFITNIFLVYVISFQIIKEKKLSIVAALLYAYISMRCEGLSVLLEVPSVTFALFSAFLLLKYNSNKILVAVAGFFVFCSFFTKQYGVGYFILLIFALLLNRQYKNTAIYILGFIFACCMSLLLVGAECAHVFVNTSYSGYNEAAASNTILTPVVKYLKAFLTMLRIAPIMIVVLISGGYFLFKGKIKWNRSYVLYLVLICGILGFLMQFIFAPYYHYYQYLIPCIAIVSVWMVVKMNKRWMQLIWKMFLIITFAFSILRIGYNGIYTNWKSQKKVQQLDLSLKIKDIIGSNNSTLFIKEGNLMPQYYLTGYKPYDLNYSFGNLSEETYLKAIGNSEFLLINNKSETLNTPLIVDAIEKKFCAFPLDGNKDVLLYKIVIK